jgi:hypothetical protein
MNTKELYEKYINKKVHVSLGGLKVGVVILDIKNSYGKIRYQVSPVTGTGEVWVENILDF